jgi:hypothetical protein
MSDYLDELGRQLRLAADNHHHDTAAQIAQRPRISSPRPMILAVALAVLTLAGAAAAATTLLQTGSPVNKPPGASSTAGVGLPVRGASRLLPLRVPDPAGGPPWGMRVTRTTRGLVCLQVGRVYRGRLGLLGLDGAFGNDGRFHPLATDALTSRPDLSSGLGPAGSIQTCEAPTMAQAQAVRGVSPSGVQPLGFVPAGQQRRISYGILGPHAQSIRYRAHGHQLSTTLLRPLGAYLIVVAGPPPGDAASPGNQGSGASLDFPLSPVGAVNEITYRFGGKTCTDSTRPKAPNTCPVPNAPAPSTHSRQLHRPVVVRLRRQHRTTDAIVSFRAPYQVSNALSGYAIEIPSFCHPGGGGGNIETPIDRDIKTGQLVTTRVQDVFANACGPTVTLKVLYQANNPTAPYGSFTGSVVVGQTTIPDKAAR